MRGSKFSDRLIFRAWFSSVIGILGVKDEVGKTQFSAGLWQKKLKKGLDSSTQQLLGNCKILLKKLKNSRKYEGFE